MQAPGAQLSTSATDVDLMAAIAGQGDRAAFATIFERYAGRVKGFLINGGATPEQAEEIAQDVMVTIWRKAASFDSTRAGVSTWIFTIARNRRIDILRKESRPEPDPNDPHFVPAAPVDPASQLAAQDRDKAVRQALDDLSEEQREVVRLSFFASLSHGEIAAELKMPLGTVKSRLRLAFGRLRSALGDDFSGELLDDR